MGRGTLTDEIKVKAMELLNEEFTVRKLRLIPYLHHVMVDAGGRIDSARINDEESEILADWKLKGFIGGTRNKLGMTKKFWDAISELLWLGYVNI